MELADSGSWTTSGSSQEVSGTLAKTPIPVEKPATAGFLAGLI
jgi:hypothetical protein